MREVIIELRVMWSIWLLRLKIFWSEITAPFQVAVQCVKRYSELRKIDKESKDRWERHVKLSELRQKDELDLRRSKFFLERAQIIGAFFRTAMKAECYLQFQENPNEVERYRQEFQEKKEELTRLVNELEEYDEITFDEDIKGEIIAWEFEHFKTAGEMNSWFKRFAAYIQTLDII